MAHVHAVESLEGLHPSVIQVTKLHVPSRLAGCVLLRVPRDELPPGPDQRVRLRFRTHFGSCECEFNTQDIQNKVRTCFRDTHLRDTANGFRPTLSVVMWLGVGLKRARSSPGGECVVGERPVRQIAQHLPGA